MPAALIFFAVNFNVDKKGLFLIFFVFLFVSYFDITLDFEGPIHNKECFIVPTDEKELSDDDYNDYCSKK